MLYTSTLLNMLRRKKLNGCIALGVLCVITILQTWSPDLYFINFGPLEDVSCHYSEVGDALPRAEGSFQPPARSIFFLETSCRGGLDARQACAVESAARAHPAWQINVLFAAPVTDSSLRTGSLSVLRNLSNVRLSRVRLEHYAKNTPLAAMVSGGALNRTRWKISHTSDVLRYLTLYKYGGIYLDLDVVVARPLDGLARDWAARESPAAVAAGALAFSRGAVGRAVAEAAVRDIQSKYRGDVWGNNGPGVITRVLGARCAGAEPRAMSVATCNGFEVYGPQFFYPVEWRRGHVYFEPGEIDEGTAYIFHVWNKVTYHLPVHKDSPYAKLARRHCPHIYKLHKSAFGQTWHRATRHVKTLRG